MSAPLISVVLTSYNHAEFLRDSIESVLSQTYENIELIISDDASTDGSQDIIRSYDDPRIRVMLWDKNRRRKNHAQAYYAAKGDFFAIHHSDDLWLPDKLEKQLKYVQNPRVGAAFTQVQGIDDKGNSISDSLVAPFAVKNMSRHSWLREFFFNGNRLCHPSVLLRSEFIPLVYPKASSLIQIPDLRGWVRLCKKSEIRVLPQKLVKFRIHSDNSNLSAFGVDNYIRFQNEMRYLLEEYTSITDPDELLKIFPEIEYFLVDGEMDTGFALSQLLLSQKNSGPHLNLGIEMLYSILDDPDRADFIEKNYNFNAESLRQLVTKHDIYAHRTMHMLQEVVREREQKEHH
ncbi:glycosyltransferase [Desulfobaculum bizertense]|uniref:Glycosyl transferase family 2 n=1 Tax=Desulfobaculum bizertense DSM 18034 TaxID=1121442 RepID=A0A1T4VYZ6_9BACT|nr:glycosyltransferase [Desulfobaculum bizertense]SKA70244.1 Glycosyl transferase family 2 [Desulfobaculum bizertense DSM 18034]